MPESSAAKGSDAGGADPGAEFRVIRELKDDGFAQTRLVEAQRKLWVHKRFRFRFSWGRPFAPLARAQWAVWKLVHPVKCFFDPKGPNETFRFSRRS